jgi:HEPN domain-containing protein
VKRLGLGVNSKKLFKCIPCNNPPFVRAPSLWITAKEYFCLGMMGFKAHPIVWGGKTISYRGFWTASLMLFQQAFELYLKSLLCFKGLAGKPYQHHQLEKLLDLALLHYPELATLKNNKQACLVIAELSEYYSDIKYGEVMIIFRPSNKKVYATKPRYEEFIDTLYFIQEQFENAISALPQLTGHSAHAKVE